MPGQPLQSISRLIDALSRATSLDRIYEASLDALQESLGVDRASILLFDQNDFMDFVAWRGLSDQYRAAVSGHTPWRPDSTEVEPLLVPDCELDPSLTAYAEIFRAENIRALGFFALIYRDRVIGKFMLYYAEPHEFTPQELALAKTVAGQIAFGVTRFRAEAALEAERERLIDLVANVPGMVWESEGEPGIDQRLTFVSDGIEPLIGYTAEEWRGNPNFWSQVVLDNAGDCYRFRRKDGRVIWVEVRRARKRVDGKMISRGVTMDITERQRTEARNKFLAEASGVLSRSLDYETTLTQVARLIVAHLADWCVIDIVGEDGNVDRITVAHRDPEKATLARRIRDEFPPSQHEIGLARQVVESGEPLLVAEVDDATRGRYRELPVGPLLEQLGYHSFMIVPLVAGGRTFGAISVVSADPSRCYDANDLELATELGRRAGYAIDHARLYRQAQEANRAKDEFLATLSHELRTPMTATLGWATMLRHGDMSRENFRLAVETIERSTHAQAKLIDEILDVSRIVTGKLQLSIDQVDLPQVIRAAVETIRPSIMAKNIALEMDLRDVRPLQGDAARLQQVIWNLLSNAVKFTPAGGAIAVTLEDLGDAARVSVRDTGQGIARKVLPFIFDRFRQGDSSASRAHGGLGLGLAIVKNIVELHGGSATAASDGDGKGAVFTLTLPLAPATAHAGIAAMAESDPSLSLNGVSVLVVEDEDDTRSMLAAALQNFGANVVAVASAPAAIEALRSQAPHVVVSDIAMPGEDGYSLMTRIRSGDEVPCRDIPSIALTAYAAPEDHARIAGAGFDQHLSKPVDPMVVVRTVRDLAARV